MGIDPEVEHRIIGTEPSIVDDSGLRLMLDGVYDDLAPYDLLDSGGFGTRPLMEDARFIAYLRTWGPDRPIVSVCTGALLLGRAGYLTGRRATTHHNAYDALRPFVARS